MKSETIPFEEYTPDDKNKASLHISLQRHCCFNFVPSLFNAGKTETKMSGLAWHWMVMTWEYRNWKVAISQPFLMTCRL